MRRTMFSTSSVQPRWATEISDNGLTRRNFTCLSLAVEAEEPARFRNWQRNGILAVQRHWDVGDGEPTCLKSKIGRGLQLVIGLDLVPRKRDQLQLEPTTNLAFQASWFT